MSSPVERFPEVSFGTSGIRALVSELRQDVVTAYTYAFVERMKRVYGLEDGNVVVIGMDLRPSSPSIATSVCGALRKMGFSVEFSGALPTPALALRCLATKCPGIMITGSHIPFDRNGIKFYSATGEILKDDEDWIASCPVPDAILSDMGNVNEEASISPIPVRKYKDRYIDYFGRRCIEGLSVGVYEHSAVGRDITKEILQDLGASVVSVGRSDHFVPVDTEAVTEEDRRQASAWCLQHRLDALVSTDGDGDRPLVFDENGEFIRGDLLGLLCAKYLMLSALAIPVSCNTAIEKSECFDHIVRTKIGSPYVVAAMAALGNQQNSAIGGFEANGGFLLGSQIDGLSALPTRDALLPIITLLKTIKDSGRPVSSVVSALPQRFTYSSRIKNFSHADSDVLVRNLARDKNFRENFFPDMSPVKNVDITDGVRLTFSNEIIIHIRPSGNAPEIRCYTEADSPDKADQICITTLRKISETKNSIQNL